jgi:DNA-binding PadR family transcriptional regulator
MFEQAVMLSILRLGDEAYGRAILGDVEARLGRSVTFGAVQATLARLEQKALLTSHLGSGTEVRAGRPRRFYQLAPSGRRALEEARVAVTILWRGVGRKRVFA